ncbi:MAG: PAS domain S-box protein [bacterium]|nr:PAS domain S-box protein [bacterium]
MKFYGEIFRKIRKSKKIPISTLAKAINRSYNAILKWEKGERNPSAGDIRLIASIMRINPSEISDLKDDIPESDILLYGRTNKIFDNIMIEKYLGELKHIIENFGDIPDINIDAVIQLENRVNQTNRQINIVKNKSTDYQNILNLAPIIIYTKDSSLHYKYINDAFVKQTGLHTDENIIGSTASQLFGLEEVLEINKYEQEVFSSKKEIYNKEVHIPGTNSQKTGLLNIFPFSSKHDDMGKILCTIRDITCLKKILDRFEKLDVLLNTMSEYIYIKTLQPKKTIYRSKGIEYITGRKQVEFYKDENLWLSLVHPDDRKEAEISLNNTELAHYVIKYRVLHKSGQYKWVENQRYRHCMPDTNIYYYYGTIRDITDKIKNEELEELLIIYTNFIDAAISIADYESKKFLYINKKLEEITGYSCKEFINCNAENFILQKLTLLEDKEKVRKILDDESILNFKVRVICKNKKIKLIDITRKHIEFKGRKCAFVSYKMLENLGPYGDNSIS